MYIDKQPSSTYLDLERIKGAHSSNTSPQQDTCRKYSCFQKATPRGIANPPPHTQPCAQATSSERIPVKVDTHDLSSSPNLIYIPPQLGSYLKYLKTPPQNHCPRPRSLIPQNRRTVRTRQISPPPQKVHSHNKPSPSMATAHLLSNLLPVDSVKLGRLVRNAKCPHQEFIDPIENKPLSEDFLKTIQHGFSETRKFSKCSKLRPYLSRALSFSYIKQDDSTATLSGPTATIYELQNSDSWFELACKQEKAQTFLEKAFEGRNSVYLVVGFRTVYDGRMDKTLKSRRTRGLQGELPIDAIAAGVVAPGLKGSQTFGSGQELVYKATGEQVFAILYRKVKLRFLSSRKVGNMTLEEGYRWKSCWDWRDYDSEPGDGEDDEDIAEASLTDADLEDLSDDDYESEEPVAGVEEEEEEEEPVGEKPKEEVHNHTKVAGTADAAAPPSQKKESGQISALSVLPAKRAAGPSLGLYTTCIVLFFVLLLGAAVSFQYFYPFLS